MHQKERCRQHQLIILLLHLRHQREPQEEDQEGTGQAPLAAALITFHASMTTFRASEMVMPVWVKHLRLMHLLAERIMALMLSTPQNLLLHGFHLDHTMFLQDLQRSSATKRHKQHQIRAR